VCGVDGKNKVHVLSLLKSKHTVPRLRVIFASLQIALARDDTVGLSQAESLGMTAF
jgi:hypothetical protein